MAEISKKIVGMLVGLGTGDDIINRWSKAEIEIISEIMDEKSGIDDKTFNIVLLGRYFDSIEYLHDYPCYLKILADHPEAVVEPRKAAAEITIIDMYNILRQLIFIVCGPSRFNRAINLAKLSHIDKDCSNMSILLIEMFRFIISNPGQPISANYKNIITKCSEYIDVTERFTRFMREFESPYIKPCETIYDYLVTIMFIHDTEFTSSNVDLSIIRERYKDFPLLEMLIGACRGIENVHGRDSTYLKKIVDLIAKLA